MRAGISPALAPLLAASALFAAGTYFIEGMKQPGEAVTGPADLYFTGYDDTPWFQSLFHPSAE